MDISISIPVPIAFDDDVREPRISEFEVAASYNWLDEYTPTIMVPGIPPLWSPPSTPPLLKSDSGVRYVDQNTDRNPVSPLASLIRAVQTSRPDLDFSSINVVTDRRPIRKLYGFVNGDNSEFVFGVTILGDTALFTRIEKQTRDERVEVRFNEYRQNFETAYLKIPVSAKGSTSHHRVVRYVVGGMTFLVRSAVDAYMREREEEPRLANGDTRADPDDDKEDDEEDEEEEEEGKENEERLTDYVKALSLEEPSPSFRLARTASVIVIPGGNQIPHAATLEMSTRYKWAPKVDLCARKMPDLWISQTANYIEAYHIGDKTNDNNLKNINRVGSSLQHGRSHGSWRGGMSRWSKPSVSQTKMTRFTDIRIKPLAAKLVAWETANTKTLEMLMMVIKQVIQEAKHLQGSCLVKFDETNRSLKVMRAQEGEVPGLPEDLQQCFS